MIQKKYAVLKNALAEIMYTDFRQQHTQYKTDGISFYAFDIAGLVYNAENHGG